MPLGVSAQEVTAIATAVVAVAGVSALALAGWQVFEARKLRSEEFRPWVVVGFHFRGIVAFASIRNVGRTVAREVKITFDPPLASTLMQAREPAMLSEPLPQLAPGEGRLVLLDRVPDRLASDLPTRHKVTARYRDHLFREMKPTDEFVLDFALLDGTKLPDKGMHDLVEAVVELRKPPD